MSSKCISSKLGYSKARASVRGNQFRTVSDSSWPAGSRNDRTHRPKLTFKLGNLTLASLDVPDKLPVVDGRERPLCETLFGARKMHPAFAPLMTVRPHAVHSHGGGWDGEGAFSRLTIEFAASCHFRSNSLRVSTIGRPQWRNQASPN